VTCQFSTSAEFFGSNSLSRRFSATSALTPPGLTRVATLLSKWQNSSKRCFMRREDGLEVVLSQAETDSHRQFATHRPNFANQKLLVEHPPLAQLPVGFSPEQPRIALSAAVELQSRQAHPCRSFLCRTLR